MKTTRADRIARVHKRQAHQNQSLNNVSETYIFQNNTNGDLNLPKPAKDGRLKVGINELFEGDKYFLELVKPPLSLLKYIGQKKNEEKMAESLILDQPDVITSNGKVEQTVLDDSSIIKKENENKNKKEVLLTEQPIDGVEIIID
jgi:hypothetical protein